MNTRWDIPPDAVVSDLEKHVLIDGFRVVIDLEKSQGCHLVDAVTRRELIDLYGFYGSLPVGFNHPYFDLPEVQEDLRVASKTKIANADVFSSYYATFVSTFHRVVGLPPLERYFFIDGGALAVENAVKAAMDWKVRKNLAAGLGERGTEILHFKNAFHGRSGYTLSLTNTEPRKTDYFAKFAWPRVSTPSIDFSLHQTLREENVREREEISAQEIQKFIAQRGPDIAAIIIEPIQGEGGDNHFRAEWFRVLRDICDRHDILLIFDEVQSGVGLTGRTWACEHFRGAAGPDRFWEEDPGLRCDGRSPPR